MAAVSDSTLVDVKNLVDYKVGYFIKEDNIRRQFNPQEVKKLKAGELRKLNYMRGGHVLLTDYLSVGNRDLAHEFGIDDDVFDNEYNWDVAKVDSVLTSEPIEVLQDAMDFAPNGIKELIKDRAVELKIDSMDKRQTISTSLGIDLNGMIDVQKIKEEDADTAPAKPKSRRASQAKGSDNGGSGKQRRAVKTTEAAE